MKTCKQLFVLSLSLFVLTGCAATRKLALNSEKPIDVSSESIAVFTLKAENWSVPKYKPHAFLSYLWKIDEPKPKKFNFTMNESAFEMFSKPPEEYLLSVQLPPGQYALREIMCMSGVFPVTGRCVIPLYSEFSLNSNEIVYLGHIEAINVKRENDEDLRAGPVIPLIDQSVTGFGGGTFRITIADDYDADIAKFKEKYPQLTELEIVNRAMPSWSKPTKEMMTGKIYKK